ncbi:MAG: DUF2344 domain-containing protein, partial [Calditrichaeota bacterium]
QEHGRQAQVTISVASHIPKPHAPFQWLGFEDRDSLREKQKYLLSLIKPYKRLRFKYHDVDHSWLEAIFSRGDRRLSKAIELAYRRGCRFDAWSEQLKIEVWRQVFEDLQMDTEIWLKDVPLYAPLPWDHLDTRVKKEFLIRELKRALRGKFTPACEKPYKKKEEIHRTDLGRPDEKAPMVCYHCGLECDLEAIRQERIESWRSLERGIHVKLRTLDDVFAGARKSITRYRAAYRKLGEFRYLSALDLTRTFTRAFSRAGVPLRYSEGYHPAPVLSFGPALGVGIESVEEFLDFETIVEVDPELLKIKLNEQLPENLRFNYIIRIDPQTESLFKLVCASEYSVQLDSKPLNAQLKHRFNGKYNGNLASLHKDIVTSFLNQKRIQIEKVKKGRTKVEDIKPLIKRISVENGKTPLSLRMILATGSRGNVRPEILLEKMYGISAHSFRIRREKMYIEKDGNLVPLTETFK